MKLDGEKLLAELVSERDWLKEQIRKEGLTHENNESVTSPYHVKLITINTFIKLIESGNYTIKDKG